MKTLPSIPASIGLLLGMICLSFLPVYGQVGSSQSNPIQIGAFNAGSQYTNNHVGFLSGSIYKVYYRFVLSSAGYIELSSGIQSQNGQLWLYLLGSTGQVLASENHLYTPLDPPGGYRVKLSMNLQPGTYFVEVRKTINVAQELRVSNEGPREIQVGFKQQMTNVFGLLEFNRIPNGLLRDASFEFANLDNYRGTTLTDTNFVDNAEFFGIHQTIATSRIGPNAPTLKASEELSSLQEGAEAENRVVLSGLFYQYSQIKAQAVQNNQIQIVNNRLQDRYVNGAWQNPYETVRAVAFAPTRASYNGKTKMFLLPSNLWMTNSQSTVSSIQFDPGDGQGYRTLTPGSTVTVNYPTDGDKTIIFRITLTNNTMLSSRSKIEIRSALTELYPTRSEIVSVQSSESLDGIPASGYMSILYANPDKKMRKPLIIAEGFDPGHLIKPNERFGDTDIIYFLNRINILSTGNALKSLLLSNQQYDIVYVDYRYGTDNIKRNALLLKEVIRIVNNRKAQAGSTQKNVVLGESMGGVVARWALKSMENQSENHQVRLFISYDSPHLGANVPLGYQHMANHVKRVYVSTGIGAPHELIAPIANWPSPNAILSMGSTPAAKQMLINYVNPAGAIDNSVHNTWQTELKNLGYPSGFSGSPLRRIAVSNGVECGTYQQSIPNSLLLSYVGKGNSKVLGDIVGQGLFPILVDHTRLVKFYLGTLPGRNEIKFDLKVNAIATNGGNRVYYNNMTYTKRVLWLIPISVTISSDSRNAPGGTLPFDSYGGGYYYTGINPSSPSQSNWFYRYNITASAIPVFSYIPTVSALDIGSGSQTLVHADYTGIYSGANPPLAPKNSSFANFVTYDAPNGNEFHITINDRIGTWLATELNGSNATIGNCSYLCSGVAISGPSNICSAQSYQLSGVPQGLSITWSATPSNAVTISGSGNTVMVTPTASFSGQVTLKATVNGTCGSRVIQTVITGGAPIVTGIANQTGQYCTNGVQNTILITTTSFNPAASYEVQIVNPSTNAVVHTYTATSLNSSFYFYGSPGYYFIKARVINHPCGTGAWSTYPAQFNNCFGYLWKVYPNPADDTFTVSFTDEQANITNRSTEETSFSVTLYDSAGRIIKTGNSRDGRVTLDTSSIPEGEYFLHVIQNGEIERHQIVIKHR